MFPTPTTFKKIFKKASIAPEGSFWRIELDGKPLKVRNEVLIRVPTKDLAQAIANEWENASDIIHWEDLVLTRWAGQALIISDSEITEAIDKLASYVQSDTLLFLSPSDSTLAKVQQKEWGGLISWFNARFKTQCQQTTHLQIIALSIDGGQPAFGEIQAYLEGLCRGHLVAALQLSELMGSLILTLALFEKKITPDEAFELAFLEELNQSKKWGTPEENQQRRDRLKKTIHQLVRFIELGTK